MANPNIVAVSSILGKSAVLQVTDSAQVLVSNPTSSGKVYKLNSLYASNIDGDSNAALTVEFFRNSTVYHIVKALVVPADATIDVLSSPIYLEEEDAIRLKAAQNNYLEAIGSYEEIS